MIIVVGAGVIGLSIAWQIARRGIPITVFEANSAAQQASWAAAGMLAVQSETHVCSSLARQSLSLYPEFLRELCDDSGQVISLIRCGTLIVAITQEDESWLHHQYENMAAANWMSGAQCREMEPSLSSKVKHGVWLPDEGQINNRKMLQALQLALKRRGGGLVEHMPVKGLWMAGDRVAGVILSNGDNISSSIVVNCAGAWAPTLDPQIIAMKPIKGQILTVQNNGIRRVIRSRRIYLVPKDDGQLRVGATSVDAGYDQSVTVEGVIGLLRQGCDVVPSLRCCQLLEATAALRPQMTSQIPAVGSTATLGYFQAYGHGRHGILLAPITSYQISKEILCVYGATERTSH